MYISSPWSDLYLFLKLTVTTFVVINKNFKWSVRTMAHGQSSFCLYKNSPFTYSYVREFKMDKQCCKSVSQGHRKSKTAAWILAPWQTSLLFDGIKPFLAAGLMLSQWRKKLLKVCLPLGYTFYSLQWSRHPLHRTNYI